MINSSPSLICQSFPWFWVFLYQHIFYLLSHLSKHLRRVVYTHCLYVLSPLASLKPPLSCISLFQWSAFSKDHQWLSIINNWYALQDFYHSHPSHPPSIGRLFLKVLLYSTISTWLKSLGMYTVNRAPSEGLWNIYPNSNLYQCASLILLEYLLQICKWTLVKPPIFSLNFHIIFVSSIHLANKTIHPVVTSSCLRITFPYFS